VSGPTDDGEDETILAIISYALEAEPDAAIGLGLEGNSTLIMYIRTSGISFSVCAAWDGKQLSSKYISQPPTKLRN